MLIESMFSKGPSPSSGENPVRHQMTTTRTELRSWLTHAGEPLQPFLGAGSMKEEDSQAPERW